ncbi:MAG: ATP-binding protein [Syntrophobacteraceae bacterium]
MDSLPQKLKQRSRHHFIQPLAVAMVFVLFALLFFGTAMMDLGRLESLLLDSLRKKALYVVSLIEKASQEKYRRLMREGEEYRELSTGRGIDDLSFSLQEALARELIDLAHQIGLDKEDPVVFESRIRELATSEHLQAIGLFDEQGVLVFQSAPLPPDVVKQTRAMVISKEDIAVHLFHGAKAQHRPNFVAARKQNGMGAVVLVLDRQGMELWGRRVAIQAAAEDLQWGTGVAYLTVEDKGGRMLTRFGNMAHDKVEECILAAGAARDSGGADVQCVKVGDVNFLELSFPFAWEGKSIGTAHVGLETRETDQILLENQRRIFLWTGLMVAIGLFAMGALYRTQNRHVAKIQAMRERLNQTERLSSLGKLAAGVAHEIRNPLNAISMAAQRIQPGAAKEKLERISHIIQDETKRLNKIVEDFLGLSRSNRMEFKAQSIIGLLDRVFFLVREEAGPRGIHVTKQWTNQSFRIFMDAGKMEQALLNICRNAIESISVEGSITMSSGIQDRNTAYIRIKDTGNGIPAGQEKQIFDPFYTSKEHGVGLGLAIAHEIILAHGGEIQVQSESGKGSTFEVLLPLQP